MIPKPPFPFFIIRSGIFHYLTSRLCATMHTRSKAGLRQQLFSFAQSAIPPDASYLLRKKLILIPHHQNKQHQQGHHPADVELDGLSAGEF